MVQARTTLRRSDGGEELDNANKRQHAPQDGGHHAPAPFTRSYERANFKSLIALKSLTSPPTRLVA